jgi:hypothetical protein
MSTPIGTIYFMFGIGNIMKKTMQSKFESALQAGKTLTVAQIQKIGFANAADPAYQARSRGINVQREVLTTKTGSVSRYFLEA